MSKLGDEPAHPVPLDDFRDAGNHPMIGLTKRERFVMAAMQGITSGEFTGEDRGLWGDDNAESRRKRVIQLSRMAKDAAEIADAQLARLAGERRGG